MLFLLCLVFVPVDFFYGIAEWTVPLSAVGWQVAMEGSGALRRAHGLFFFYLAFYPAGFAIAAWLAARATQRFFEGRKRRLARAAIAIVPLAISFFPLITHSGLRGEGGHYNFWNAVERYYELRAQGRRF